MMPTTVQAKRPPTKTTGRDKPRGLVMLLSLLILSAITAVAIGMSIVIIRDVQSSSSVDRSIIAYYAAESSLERGLAQVKQSRFDRDSLSTALDSVQQVSNNNLGNGASYSSSSSTTSEIYTLTSLQKNQSVVLDLYDPTLTVPANFQSFWVEAEDANPQANPAWVEVSYFPWVINLQGQIDWSDILVEKRLRSIWETSPSNPNHAAGFVLSGSNNYRVRVRALYDDLKNVRISAYSSADPYHDTTNCPQVSDCLKPIPNRIFINAKGSAGSSNTTLTASVPWQVPAAAMFDYVLFSEQTLDKRT